ATGTISALAGVFWTLRYDSARGDNAMGLELVVVAAVLVGGVSIFGGRGSLVGVIAGVLVIGALRSALRLADVSSDAITVATGLLLVVSVIVPSIITAVQRLVQRRRAAAAASWPCFTPCTTQKEGRTMTLFSKRSRSGMALVAL